MDISLLRTFIEVSNLRHFGRAADKLCVTQSAVSARIKLLESTLGLELFNRKRNDIQLTPSGKRLLRHAEIIVRSWERARQELALEPEVASLAVGFSSDLWDILVRNWASAIRQQQQDVALQLEMHTLGALSDRVSAGTLDIAFMFEPPQVPGMEIHEVSQIDLRLISTQEGLHTEEAFDSDYILVDWGISFALRHAAFYGNRAAPRLRTSTGGMARELLLKQRGAAYLCQQSVYRDLECSDLYLVTDAPVINRPVFAIFRAGREDESRLIDLIKRIKTDGLQ